MLAAKRIINKHFPIIGAVLVLLVIVMSRMQTADRLNKEIQKIDFEERVAPEPPIVPKLRPETTTTIPKKEENIPILQNPEPNIDETTEEQEPLTCPEPPFQKLGGGGSIIQLASFPGSGNTWIRHLIQRGSGVLTGSVYNDKSLYVEFPGESVRDASVIAVKTHFPCAACWNVGPEKKIPARESQTGVLRDYRATIQVLRSPFGAMLSDFNHKRSGANHTGVASKEEFESSIFDDFIKTRMAIWTRHATYYLNRKSKDADNIWLDEKGKPVLLIYYEDLKKNSIAEMKKIFDFIKQYSSNDPKIASMDASIAARCSIARDAIGGFRRSGSKSKPYEKIVEGRTLREIVCDYVRDKCTDFWKTNDPEWSCS